MARKTDRKAVVAQAFQDMESVLDKAKLIGRKWKLTTTGHVFTVISVAEGVGPTVLATVEEQYTKHTLPWNVLRDAFNQGLLVEVNVAGREEARATMKRILMGLKHEANRPKYHPLNRKVR